MPALQRALVKSDWFNPNLTWLPYNLQRRDFENTMNEIYDFVYELNLKAVEKGWQRLEDMLPAQSLSGMMSAMLKVSLAQYSRSLVGNMIENGFPDLIPAGAYPDNRIENGQGIEVKSTNKSGGAVDMHSAHEGWICVFVYATDVNLNTPINQRHPFQFTEVFCGRVFSSDYRLNGRGTRGTRTATLDKTGLEHFRKFWVYASDSARTKKWFRLSAQEEPDLKRMPVRTIEYTDTWYNGPAKSYAR